MGAGVIPFSVYDGNVQFLFQSTFSGRKTGYLIDFGGGLGDGEGYREAAVREFVEETETLYFAQQLQSACRGVKQVNQQIPIVETLFERTLSMHPDWWCDRLHAKSWRTYFIEFPYRDVSPLNREWQEDSVGRFKKRRELRWVVAEDLLTIYETSPEQLWKRVRQLEQAPNLIREIVQIKGASVGDRFGSNR
jgi:8-oxo-dGTP pyrophosphatase MutT (NUDIX family)